MADITLSLTDDEITQAIKNYVNSIGYRDTDHFSVTIRVTRGDDSGDYTYATVSGIVVNRDK